MTAAKNWVSALETARRCVDLRQSNVRRQREASGLRAAKRTFADSDSVTIMAWDTNRMKLGEI